MDGLAVRVLSADWNARYHLARIDKIHQPSERELVLTLRTRQRTTRVVLSAHRTFARAHELHTSRPANPEEPPVFCMRMRKHLEGGRVIEVRQQGYDRVLELCIENLNEIGDTVHFVVILEMMGKHSNLIVCAATPTWEPGRIIDSIVHVTHDMSRVRPIYPGLDYCLPPNQVKVSYETLTSNEVQELELSHLSEKERIRTLMRRIAGLGTPTAQEVLSRCPVQPEDPTFPAHFVEITRAVFEAALMHREQPSVGLDDLGRPVAAAPFSLTSFSRYDSIETFDEALDALYQAAQTSAKLSNRASSLLARITDELDRLRGKLIKLAQLFEEAQNHHELRVKGELLTAYGHTLKKGLHEAELANFYDEEKPLRVALDPALTPMENAQKYFKQSSKKKRGLPILTKETEQTSTDIQYLETTVVHLQDADADNLQTIERELVTQGIIKAPRHLKSSRPKIEPGPGQPNVFQSSDGFVIRVGRNNLQNDRLTLRQGQPNDLWFHVKDQPGSHVVMQTQNQPVPERTLFEAALLAAYFSKARDSGNVAVDYTLVKHVWKANGARPGHVLYEGHQTLFVTPDRTLLAPLLTQLKK